MTSFHRSSKWLTFTRKARPIIARTLPAPCVDPLPDCPGIVYPGDEWDVSHLVAYSLDPTQPLSLEYVGPAHARCNRTKGGRLGRARQLNRKRRDERLPDEDSGW